MTYGQNFFDQPIKNDLIKKSTGQGDDYTTGYFLDYLYFKEHYKMIAIDLRKQQSLDADLEVIQQINFTKNLGECLSLIEE